MQRRHVGYGLVAVGLVLVIAGAAGLVTSGGDDTVSTGASSSTTTTAVEEHADMFLTALAVAVRSGDDAFLLARLHPEVIARYGDATCRAHVERIQDATAGFEIVDVAPPAPFVWTLDGVSTTIPDAVTVHVTQTSRGQTREADVHLARVGRQLRWFTDCGDPVTGQES